MGRPSRVSDVRVPGPLAPFADAYKVRLRARGYTPLTTVNELRQVAHLSRWLEEQGTGTAGLTSQGLRQFFVSRRAEVGPKGCSSQSLLLLLEVLREAGAVEAEPPLAVSSGSEAVIVSFWHYLVAERGVTCPTAVSYILRARRFMAAHAPGGDLQGLQPSDVTSAVLAESARVSVGGVQLFVVALRAFLRFCFLEGLIERDFSGAALAMTGRRRSSLPRGVARPDAEALLRTCDRRTAMGRRDYAIILTLLRLGLRAGEVTALSLDDIDWRAGEIVVHGKGGRLDRLPLPVDVGAAVAAYLERGRTPSSCRAAFLRLVAPVRGLGRGGVSLVVRRACRKAGITPFGAHRLRHTVACDMVAAGVALPEIGAVLRHSSAASTGDYARADIESLRELALPWPGRAPQ
jgi:integrase/recombinase XerD